ncbi:hypothetical protein [Sutcliffiella rhizosphaerae]|uniref:Aspartyl-phosphate phosphatase Spo0E family protein n=1 Tax=Sutcliffiella rhizosphaerae TaxID=2880967 RepID=A0ABM8YTK1_9BACI|nr:hypothetical protein [Sutcliffiella rhizosphaerae]CAG9623245.1 hypothetical protein BACCIP111883_04041 [Sutcliffiella rhizosphaerae]
MNMKDYSNINSNDEIIKLLQYAYQQGIERKDISMMELVDEMKQKLQVLIK